MLIAEFRNPATESVLARSKYGMMRWNNNTIALLNSSTKAGNLRRMEHSL
jgi:hypothetical protein